MPEAPTPVHRASINIARIVWTTFALAAAVCIIVAVSVRSGAGTQTPTDDRKLTPTEAACDMLRDGETPQFTYDVMVDLLEQHSFEFPNPEVSARAAVQAAQDQGC